MTMKYEIVINGARRNVEFTPQTNGTARVTFSVDGRLIEDDAIQISRGEYSVLISGRSLDVTTEETSDGLLLRTKDCKFQVEIIDPRSWRRRRGAGIELEGRQQLIAPMPGKIVRVLVAAGPQVQAGPGLAGT